MLNVIVQWQKKGTVVTRQFQLLFENGRRVTLSHGVTTHVYKPTGLPHRHDEKGILLLS